jgi:hypothetical protein
LNLKLYCSQQWQPWPSWQWRSQNDARGFLRHLVPVFISHDLIKGYQRAFVNIKSSQQQKRTASEQLSNSKKVLLVSVFLANSTFTLTIHSEFLNSCNIHRSNQHLAFVTDGWLLHLLLTVLSEKRQQRSALFCLCFAPNSIEVVDKVKPDHVSNGPTAKKRIKWQFDITDSWFMHI